MVPLVVKIQPIIQELKKGNYQQAMLELGLLLYQIEQSYKECSKEDITSLQTVFE